MSILGKMSVIGLMVISGVLMLGISMAKADPAVVIKNDGQCGIPGADADGNFIIGGVGIVKTKVENDNKVMLKCMGSEITNMSGRGQHFEGFLCGISIPSGGFVLTNDTHATVTPSQIGTLTCTFHKDGM